MNLSARRIVLHCKLLCFVYLPVIPNAPNRAESGRYFLSTTGSMFKSGIIADGNLSMLPALLFDAITCRVDRQLSLHKTHIMCFMHHSIDWWMLILYQVEEEDDESVEQFAALNHNDVAELFRLCDSDNSGYIEKAELSTILPQVDNITLERLIQELDCDGDGKISLPELEKGLRKLTSADLIQHPDINSHIDNHQTAHMDSSNNNRFHRHRR